MDEMSQKAQDKRELVKTVIHRADDMIANNLKIFTKSNIKKSLRERNFKKDPLFWNNGVLSLSINEYERLYGSLRLENNLKLLDKKGDIKFVDDALYYYANFNQLGYTEAKTVFSFLLKAKKDSKGSIMYRESNHSAFIDTIGMVCPFLFRYGNEYGSSEAIQLAMSQFRLFFDEGFDETSQLPYHGYNLTKNEKNGIIGWGRGVGWMMFGLVEALYWADKISDEHKELKEMYNKILSIVLRYQRADGGFSWQLQAKDGPLDISATAMIGYSLAKYDRLVKSEKHTEVLNGLESRLLQNIDSHGYVLNSSAECRGFSMYPQIFESNSWGQGFSALFLLARLVSPVS